MAMSNLPKDLDPFILDSLPENIREEIINDILIDEVLEQELLDVQRQGMPAIKPEQSVNPFLTISQLGICEFESQTKCIYFNYINRNICMKTNIYSLLLHLGKNDFFQNLPQRSQNNGCIQDVMDMQMSPDKTALFMELIDMGFPCDLVLESITKSEFTNPAKLIEQLLSGTLNV